MVEFPLAVPSLGASAFAVYNLVVVAAVLVGVWLFLNRRARTAEDHPDESSFAPKRVLVVAGVAFLVVVLMNVALFVVASLAL